MNKYELVEAVTNKMKMTFDHPVSKANVTLMLSSLDSVVTEALKNGDEVPLTGLGKLKVTQKAARTGRNPKTGEAIQIAAKNAVKFSPAKALSDAIN